MSEDFIQRAIIGLPILIFSLTVHEFFHAWSAMKFGDDTAQRMGRLTLNPLAHLDLFGTIMMVVSQFRFGWAKPVPVNPYNLRNPRQADFWISFAGPLSNLGLATIFALLLRTVGASSMGSDKAVLFLFTAVQINVWLALFNLIPLFPLDGSHMLRNVLPDRYEYQLDQLERFSPIILIGLVIFGFIGIIIGPPASAIIHLLVFA